VGSTPETIASTAISSPPQSTTPVTAPSFDADVAGLQRQCEFRRRLALRFGEGAREIAEPAARKLRRYDRRVSEAARSRGRLWTLRTRGLGRAENATAAMTAPISSVSKEFRPAPRGPMAPPSRFENSLNRAYPRRHRCAWHFGTALGPGPQGPQPSSTARRFDTHPVVPPHFRAAGSAISRAPSPNPQKQAAPEIRTDAEVQHIRVKDGSVTGVVSAAARKSPSSYRLRCRSQTHLLPSY